MDWMNGFEGAVTICDLEGIVIYMNDFSKKEFSKDGGELLIGKSLMDCHPEPAQRMLHKMFQEPIYHSYTRERNGVKKMVHQSPWFVDGEHRGVIEISFVIPQNMAHHKRG